MWSRKVHSDTPLPQHYETSLRVAISVYQGSATVSLTQLTRDGGRQAKTRSLWFDKADFTPDTYQEALTAILQAVEYAKNLLASDGIG